MPQTMRAAVLHSPQNLRVETVPVPRPGPGQQLVRVAACGICGSDLRYLVGENPWAVHTLGVSRPNPADMILGHEIGGLAALGDEEIAVSCLAFKGCGHCPDCRRGEEQLCAHTAHLGHGAGWEGQNPGGMAEFCPCWTEHLFRLPPQVSVEEATFLDGLAVAVHAVRQAALAPASTLLVFGGGPIGLMIAQVARAFGAARAMVVDVYQTPLMCAAELGLGPGYDLAQGAEAALVAEATATPVRAVFDTTGDLSAQRLGLRLLARGGSLTLMAGAAEGLTVSPADLAGERRLMTCSNHRYQDFGLGLRLLAGGQVKVAPMITHRFSLEEAPHAFATAANKSQTGALKVVIKP